MTHSQNQRKDHHPQGVQRRCLIPGAAARQGLGKLLYIIFTKGNLGQWYQGKAIMVKVHSSPTPSLEIKVLAEETDLTETLATWPGFSLQNVMFLQEQGTIFRKENWKESQFSKSQTAYLNGTAITNLHLCLKGIVKWWVGSDVFQGGFVPLACRWPSYQTGNSANNSSLPSFIGW